MEQAKQEYKVGVICRKERDEISWGQQDLKSAVFNPCTGIVIKFNAKKFIV